MSPIADLTPALSIKDDSTRQSSAITRKFMPWPDGVVAHHIDPLMPNPGRVLAAIRHWEELTPFRFVERANESSWVTFRAGPSGCHANVGMASAPLSMESDMRSAFGMASLTSIAIVGSACAA